MIHAWYPVLPAPVAKTCCACAAHPLAFRPRMGMGSPDNRRKADDSCRALCVGRIVSDFLRDKQLVRCCALLEKAAHEGRIASRGVLSPAHERSVASDEGGEDESGAVAYPQAPRGES